MQITKYLSTKADDEDCEKRCEAQKGGSKNALDAKRAQLMETAKKSFEKAQVFINRSPKIGQFAIGAVSGWSMGFLTNKVGKTVAITVGGTILLVTAANQTGLIKIDWDKVGKKIDRAGDKMEAKIPAMRAHAGKFARPNPYFVAGFVGGFLVGISH